jgi:hypothetical protein
MRIYQLAYCLCSVLFVVMARDSSAARSPAESVVGTWMLAAYASSMGASDPLGLNPVGLLIYDDAGNVAAQVMRCDRQSPAVTRSDDDAAAEGQRSTAVDGYAAYYGNYVVAPSARTITHVIKASVAAPDIGNSLVRHFRLQDDELVLEFTAGREFRRLHWRRASRVKPLATCAERG